MTLYRRSNGTYDAYVWIRGQRYRKATNTKDRRQAKLIDQKFREDLNAQRHGLVSVEPQMPFSVLAARFLVDASPKPYHRDRLKVLLPFFGNMEIGSVTKNTARQYRAYRHAQKTLTETTVNRDLEALRSILNWAVDEGILAANPLARLHMARERRKPRPVLSITEEEALLAVCPSHLHKITTFALRTGMRRGEILAQRWEHVDFERQLLFVSHSKTPEGEAREIPLAKSLLEQLSKNRQVTGLVFSYKAQPMKSIKTAWKTALRKSGIRRLRFHDLRHTFNSRLIEAGVIREVRMALMGHSTGEDVHSRYCQIELPLKRDAIRRLELWTESQRQQLANQQAEGEGGENSATTAARSDNGGTPHAGTEQREGSDAEVPRS